MIIIIIIPRRYLWCCHHGIAPLREFTRFIWWMQTQRQVAPPTLRPSQSTWAVSPPVGCYHPHPPSPFYYYSFYHPTEGRRLSRPEVHVLYYVEWKTRLDLSWGCFDTPWLPPAYAPVNVCHLACVYPFVVFFYVYTLLYIIHRNCNYKVNIEINVMMTMTKCDGCYTQKFHHACTENKRLARVDCKFAFKFYLFIPRCVYSCY